MQVHPIRDVDRLPSWRRPEALLLIMALAMPLAFSVWMAMLNNFAYEAAKFDGEDIGAIQAIREIPGFLAILVVYLLLFVREQSLAIISLLLLGVGTAMTGYLPSFWGIALTTLISSIGFHYYETVNQSLQLQWLSKDRAPIVLGRLAGVGSSTAFIAFGMIWFATLDMGEKTGAATAAAPYELLYLAGGIATVVLAIAAWALYPRFAEGVAQRRELVLKERYWLYYALVFFGGARRQIFVVFAYFMLVDKFKFDLHDMVTLLIINHAVNVFFAPFMGRMTARFGERAVLTFEYVGLICVFTAYAFVASPLVAAALFVIDHLFFGLHFAQRTYFQKIADPEDMAPTAAVAFTINHIAAVTLPWPLGLLYLYSPSAVFTLGVILAVASLVLGRLVPTRPCKGGETILTLRRAGPAPAE
ncbi:MAG: MFS transporter [Neomegalonema sp.]|nr:MFS transporter [Neomegalonema sp.]